MTAATFCCIAGLIVFDQADETLRHIRHKRHIERASCRELGVRRATPASRPQSDPTITTPTRPIRPSRLGRALTS
jgi:hypothetical protein